MDGGEEQYFTKLKEELMNLSCLTHTITPAYTLQTKNVTFQTGQGVRFRQQQRVYPAIT